MTEQKHRILVVDDDDAARRALSRMLDSLGHETEEVSDGLECIAKLALTHHERWDGSGYPEGLAEEDIPIEGRICAVADVFDALSTNRHYRDAVPHETVYEIMDASKGKHLEAFFDVREEIEGIQGAWSDRSSHAVQ